MQIPLYKRGEVIGYATVDDDVGPEVTGQRWCVTGQAGREHMDSGNGYPRYLIGPASKRVSIFLHHVVLGLPPGRHAVDHANDDTWDARRANLRIAGSSCNGHSKGRMRSNTSGYVGVSRLRGVWEVRMCGYGRRIHLGYYECINAAAIAYNVAALDIYGPKFARPNVLDPSRCTCGTCTAVWVDG